MIADAPRDLELHVSNAGRLIALTNEYLVHFNLLPLEDVASIECTASGFPTPTVRWLPFQEKTPSHIKTNGSVLQVYNASRLVDSTTRFVCEATNIYSNRNHTTRLKITLYVTMNVMIMEHMQTNALQILTTAITFIGILLLAVVLLICLIRKEILYALFVVHTVHV